MYKFYDVFDKLIVLKQAMISDQAGTLVSDGVEQKLGVEEILLIINPNINKLDKAAQAEIISGFSKIRIEVDHGRKVDISELFEHLYQTYKNLAKFESQAAQSITQMFYSLVKQDKSQATAKSLYEREFARYESYRDKLKLNMDGINKKILYEINLANVDRTIKQSESLLGEVSKTKILEIKAEVPLDDNDSLEGLENIFKGLISNRLVAMSEKLEQSLNQNGITYSKKDIEEHNKHHSVIIAKHLANKIIAGDDFNDIKIKNDIDGHISNYKSSLLKFNNEALTGLLYSKSKIILTGNLQQFVISGLYNDLKGWVVKKRRDIMASIVSQKQADDFGLSLMFTGSKTNSAVLTFLHSNCLPIISIIKKMLFSIYGPLLKHYEHVYDTKDKLISNNNYYGLRKLEVSTKLLLPGLLMVTSFIFLAPLFNDFLLALIIPAGMSEVIKITGFIKSIFTKNITSIKPKDLVNDRLNNIFGETIAVKVANYYQNKIIKIKNKIEGFSQDRQLTLMSINEERLNHLREELNDLQIEWKLLSTYNTCAKAITTEQARDIYSVRIAKSAQRKSSRQQELFSTRQEQYMHEIETVNQDLSESIDKALVGDAKSSVFVAKPVLFAALTDKQRTRQQKVNEYNQHVTDLVSLRR